MSESKQSKQTVFERVEFLCDKALFKGKVYRPSDLNRCKGIIIFTHGLGYCDRQYKINGQYFADNGYLMLIYNLRGHANTPGKWTLQNSVDDLIEGINFLTRRYDFQNKERICVIGHSTGALITLLASIKDKRIKFGSIVTIVTCLKDSFLHWFNSGFNKDVKEYFKTKGVTPPIIERFMEDKRLFDLLIEGKIEEKISRGELEISHRYGMLKSDSWYDFISEIVHSVDIVEHAYEITIPLLLFRGEYDEVIDVEKTNELYEHLNKKVPSKLYVTKSKNHFHNDEWDLIQSETLKFFDKFCGYKSKQEDIFNKDVLIIDDELLITKTLTKLLQKNGFNNITATNNGSEALAKIQELRENKNKEFDLIVTDIRMPGIDGIETIRRIKQIMAKSDDRESSVIFMTGYGGDRADEAKALGYVDYFHKPFNTEDFLVSIKKHLE